MVRGGVHTYHCKYAVDVSRRTMQARLALSSLGSATKRRRESSFEREAVGNKPSAKLLVPTNEHAADRLWRLVPAASGKSSQQVLLQWNRASWRTPPASTLAASPKRRRGRRGRANGRKKKRGKESKALPLVSVVGGERCSHVSSSARSASLPLGRYTVSTVSPLQSSANPGKSDR